MEEDMQPCEIPRNYPIGGKPMGKLTSVSLAVEGDEANLLMHLDHRFEVVQDAAFSNLIYRLKALVYSKESEEKHVVSYPSNWWEALKERFCPKWLRKFVEVRETTVTVNVREWFPDINTHGYVKTTFTRNKFMSFEDWKKKQMQDPSDSPVQLGPTNFSDGVFEFDEVFQRWKKQSSK